MLRRATRGLVAARARMGPVLLGPAFVAAIAYVDPGNVATNVAAGAGYGYLLVWVIVVANLAAGLVQYLSAKLGVVTGQSLPEAVAGATDVAEVIGGAVALSLLFDLPLVVGGAITGGVSMALLGIQSRRGQAPFERVVTGLLLVIAVGFCASLLVSPPSLGGMAAGLVPRFDGAASVLLAAGMLGATVMPHAVYLHSALARDRHGRPAPERLGRILGATRLDVMLAMLLAGGVNLALLVGAASLFGGTTGVSTLAGAYAGVEQAAGVGVATLFGIGLLASGLASTSVGCYAGAVIMAGLLRIRVPLLVRRVVTLVPALVLLVVGVEPTKALVLSQVVLSFGIPFALAPLVALTARRSVMGRHVNQPLTTLLAAIATGAIVALNAVLIAVTLSDAV